MRRQKLTERKLRRMIQEEMEDAKRKNIMKSLLGKICDDMDELSDLLTGNASKKSSELAFILNDLLSEHYFNFDESMFRDFQDIIQKVRKLASKQIEIHPRGDEIEELLDSVDSKMFSLKQKL